MTFLDAAVAVLEATGRPMTTHEIVEAAVAAGWLRTSGRTPVKTMDAALYTQAASATPRVVRLAEPGPKRAVRGSVRWTLANRAAKPAR